MSIYYKLEIEGVGSYRTTASLTEFGEGERGDLLTPQSSGQTANPLTGDVSISGMTFRLSNSERAYVYMDSSLGVDLQKQFMQSYQPSVAQVVEAVDPDDTSLKITPGYASTISSPYRNLWIKGECVKITNRGGAPNYTLTVTRGHYDTRAQHLPIGSDVFAAPNILLGRRVTCYAVDSVSGDTAIWWGILDSVRFVQGFAIIEIACHSGTAWLDAPLGAGRWPNSDSDYSTGITIIPRTQDGQISELFFDAPEEVEIGLTARPCLEIIGDRANGWTDWQGNTPAACVKLGDTVLACRRMYPRILYCDLSDTSTLIGPSWLGRSEGDLPTEAFEVLTTAGHSTDVDDNFNPFRRYEVGVGYDDASRNPVICALIIMLSTGEATDANPEGFNYDPADTYSYDILTAPWGLRIPRDLVDVDTFESYAGLVSIETTQLLVDSEQGWDTVRDLLWPIGLMVLPNASGQLSLAHLQDVFDASSGAISIPQGAASEPNTTYDRNFGLVYEHGRIEWTEDVVDTVILDEAKRWYPNAGRARYEVNARFYDHRDSIARSTIRSIVLENATRFLQPPPLIELDVGSTYGIQIAAGALVLLSHAKVTAGDGETAASGIGCWVVGEEWKFDKAGGKHLQLWHVGHDLDRMGMIGHCLKVKSYDPATKIVTLWTNVFDDDGDTDWADTDDNVLLCDPNGMPLSDHDEQAVSITVDSATQVTLDYSFRATGGAIVQPRPNDLIIGVDYDDADNDESDDTIYLADSDGLLGTADDDAYDIMGGMY